MIDDHLIHSRINITGNPSPYDSDIQIARDKYWDVIIGDKTYSGWDK
jgi:hypothetical protein